jgi:K+-sensing histidine kinase KdpD
MDTVQRERQQLQKLLEVSVQLSTLDLDTLLDRIVETAKDVLDAEASSLLLLDESTNRLYFAHIAPHSDKTAEALRGITLAIDEGIVGDTISRRAPQIILEPHRDPRFAAHVDEDTGFVTHSLLCVPLLAGDKVLGAIEVVNKKSGPYTEADIPICNAFATLATSALENASLHRNLERAHKRLQEMERTRTHFVATVSHELRTPVTVIKGYAQVLDQFRARLSDDKQAEFLKNIDRETDHLANLIDDLFIVNEIDHLPDQCGFVAMNVVDLVRQHVKHWQEVRPEHTYDFSPGDQDGLAVHLDQKKIRHCLYHVMDNAAKFSAKGSAIQIAVRPVTSGVEITVSDQGIGIAPDNLEHIYEPFWQADAGDCRSYGGLGLGLYIVYHVVRAHGGSVRCESRLGEGTRLTLQLPVRPPGLSDGG